LQSGRAVNLNEGRPEGWLGAPGHESRSATPERTVGRDLGANADDVQAAGTPGGGSARGGLAGTNVGRGSPRGAKLERAMGSGKQDADSRTEETEDESTQAFSGRSGGAVGGTPANKRTRGGKSTPRHRTEPDHPAKSKKRRSR
jgi:hypothetical protein